jgi:peptidase E
MTGDRRRIVAMGGGGFGLAPGDPALDAYVLDAAPARHPRICLLPTASGDPDDQIRRFYRRFRDEPCEPTHVSLFRLGTQPLDLGELLLGQDVIYVGGGSLLNLLAIWRAHRLDAVLREAWERGIVLAGLSAGAMCWFEGGCTKSFGPPEGNPGLGFLPGSLTVHADGEPERLPVWLEAVRTGELPGGWAADDGVGLVFEGTELVRVVSARPGTTALRVDAVGGELVRTRLQPELLGVGPLSTRPLPDDIKEWRRTRYGPG